MEKITEILGLISMIGLSIWVVWVTIKLSK